MKDFFVVGPVIAAGLFALIAMEESLSRRGGSATEYLLFLAVLAGVLLAWYRMKTRSAERLKALEVGRDRPRDDAPAAFDPTKAAVAIGVGAPVGVSLVAWMVSLTTEAEPGIVWGVSGMLGLASLVCGTVLMVRLGPAAMNGRDARNVHSNGRPEAWHAVAKPPVTDPDAFDLVGRRG
ncbi:MAG: hypothetical protein U0835_02135 [Isosphaeraceae bacterium]